MHVNGKCFAREITPDDWRAEAHVCGLDGNRIAARSTELSRAITANVREACSDFDAQLADGMASAIANANSAMAS